MPRGQDGIRIRLTSGGFGERGATATSDAIGDVPVMTATVCVGDPDEPRRQGGQQFIQFGQQIAQQVSQPSQSLTQQLSQIAQPLQQMAQSLDPWEYE